MIGILKYSGVKTDTLRFRAYRKVAVATLIDEHGVSKQKARTLSALLEILESHRVSYSKGAYRFQTKRVSSEVLADELGVTKRYLRMLLRILEATGIITIRRRRVGRFLNLWNAFKFTGFMTWLARYAQSRCTPVPPKEESTLRLPFRKLAFPTSDLSSFDARHAFWRVITKPAEMFGMIWCLNTESKVTLMATQTHLVREGVLRSFPSTPAHAGYVDRYLGGMADGES
ncbi:MAG: DNA-binding MarR family transcriptional regulator [Celeribacter sp.]|jgi:DNA-binding MarR family transcriptional regulator